MTVEIREAESLYGLEKGPKISVHETTFLSKKAQVALAFVERWGMVSCYDDGEDSSGRAKGRLCTESEVVQRACKITDLLFEEFEKRDWCVELPTYAELEKKYSSETEAS